MRSGRENNRFGSRTGPKLAFINAMAHHMGVMSSSSSRAATGSAMSFARLMKSAAIFFGLRPARQGAWPEPAHLGATALLVHVARVDGHFSDTERRRLEAAAHAHFCRSAREATHLVRRAQAFDDEIIDVSEILDMIGRGEDDRRRALTLAFSVATADGAMGEIEENLVWRVGRLLGFDDDAITAIRETQTAQS